MSRLLIWVNILLLTVNAFAIGYQIGQNTWMEPVAVTGPFALGGTVLATIYAAYGIVTVIVITRLMSHQATNRSDEILLALILEMHGRVASLTQQSAKMQERLNIMTADPLVPIEQLIQLERDIQSIEARRDEAEQAAAVIADAVEQSTDCVTE
jgi:hypothetical protein